MARVRRASLILLALAGCRAQGQPAPAARTPELVLASDGRPGGLTITNPGAAAVTIERAIAVEQQQAAGWQPLITELNAVGECRADAPTMPVRIAPGGKLAIVPWQGYSCSGQCEGTCRGNVGYAPGTFRFVVTVLPERRRVVGPVFKLPRF